MKTRSVILLAWLLFIPLLHFAQTEAQGAVEVLIFQEKDGRRIKEIQTGDYIRIKESEKGKLGGRAMVTSLSEEEIEVVEPRTGAKSNYLLDEIYGIDTDGSSVDGKALAITGAVILVVGTIFTIVLLSGAGTYWILALFFLFPIPFAGLVLLIIGLALGLSGKPNIILARWARKFILRKTVKMKNRMEKKRRRQRP